MESFLLERDADIGSLTGRFFAIRQDVDAKTALVDLLNQKLEYLANELVDRGRQHK
jgi:hypothetical protein